MSFRNMNKTELKELLEKYKKGTCSASEQAMVEHWYQQWDPGEFDLSEEELISYLQLIKERLPKKNKPFKKYYGIAAAIALITVGVSFYFISHSGAGRIENPETALAKQQPIIPGGNKATLTLSDGRVIVLDSTAKGKISRENGIEISKSADGQLVYRISGEKQRNPGEGKLAVMFNTISTPRGGQYQVYLPDGTHVWLNAETMLRFPVSFGNNARLVELSGEAYFEVTKNANAPFKVKTRTQEVEVLGTHFNVNAYTDEPISKTTLLEGKVKVWKGLNSVLLNPGQQASNAGGLPLNVKMLKDPDAAIAWKNGLFKFEQEDLYTIMNKVSRWYDVRVEYKGDFSGKTYGGDISRFKDVNEVLETMELTGTVHFKIEGRRIIVMP
jgi:transmembrane sensor